MTAISRSIERIEKDNDYLKSRIDELRTQGMTDLVEGSIKSYEHCLKILNEEIAKEKGKCEEKELTIKDFMCDAHLPELWKKATGRKYKHPDGDPCVNDLRRFALLAHLKYCKPNEATNENI